MSHGRAPQPFALTDPIDYEDGREALRAINSRRSEARDELKKQTDTLIDAEREYRKGRVTARVTAKATTATDRKEEIDGATADLRHTRDGCEWAVEITKEKMKELDGQRASLHRLIEWSMKLDPLAAEIHAQQRERAAVGA